MILHHSLPPDAAAILQASCFLLAWSDCRCSDLASSLSFLLSLLVHVSLKACHLQANPHKRLKQLYGPRMMAQYKGVPLGELSPHVYAIAEQVRSSQLL